MNTAHRLLAEIRALDELGARDFGHLSVAVREWRKEGYPSAPASPPTDTPEVFRSEDDAAVLQGLTLLLERVQAGWPFDLVNYPNIPAEGSDAHVVGFSSHILLHLQKQVGRLSDLLEPRAHNHQLRPTRSEVARQVAFTLIDAFRLLPLLGVKVELVHAAIRLWSEEQAERHAKLADR